MLTPPQQGARGCLGRSPRRYEPPVLAPFNLHAGGLDLDGFGGPPTVHSVVAHEGGRLNPEAQRVLHHLHPRYSRHARRCHRRARGDIFSDGLLIRGSGSAAEVFSFFCYLQGFFEWRDPDSNRGHHDFQSYSEAFRYAVNCYR